MNQLEELVAQLIVTVLEKEYMGNFNVIFSYLSMHFFQHIFCNSYSLDIYYLFSIICYF